MQQQQRRQQLSPDSKADRAEAKGRGESDSSPSSSKEELKPAAETMNLGDAASLNHAPLEQFEEMVDWTLSHEASGPSPSTGRLFSGYAFPGIGGEYDGGVSAMNAGFHYRDEDQPSSLSQEEQLADASYAMLLAKRDANTTASADGKIQEPHLNDILCGRGGSINSHPGNRVFRGWVAQRKESYNLAETKADKSRITSEILRQVRDQHPPGRFLQKKVEGGSSGDDPYHIRGWWAEVDDMKALAKISQALREGAPAFRALHGNKGNKKPRGARQGGNGRRRQKKRNSHDLCPREKRKSPPRTEATPPPPPPSGRDVPATPPLPMSTDEHELDVLFPTSNNVFASSGPNGNLLSSYPLVHMGDYTASMEEVSGAIPPTPPTSKKQKADAPDEAKPPAFRTTRIFAGPGTNTPLVSPYGEAKAAWDAISFLPSLSPTAGSDPSPLQKKAGMIRVHSLSFSDGDVHSIGSFNNPFENDNHRGRGDHKQGSRDELDMEVPPAEAIHAGAERTASFPPPLGPTEHGLSIGGIGCIPGGNNHNLSRHNSSRHKSTSRRESSLSSKSWGSISNLNNSKRKSIA